MLGARAVSWPGWCRSGAASGCWELLQSLSRAVAAAAHPGLHGTAQPCRQGGQILGGLGLSSLVTLHLLGGVLLGEPLWSLHPTAKPQIKLAWDHWSPSILWHPALHVTCPAGLGATLPAGSLSAPCARHQEPREGRRGQSQAAVCKLPLWQPGLGGGSLPWCK